MPKRTKVVAIDFAFERSNPNAKNWAKDHAGDTIDSVTNTVRDAIKGIIADAFEEGLDSADVAAELAAYLDDPNQAELIARTETMRAANAGVQASWSQAVDKGLLSRNEKQEWIGTDDDAECDECGDLEGKQATIGSSFDGLDGPPAHPNCRCTVGIVG